MTLEQDVKQLKTELNNLKIQLQDNKADDERRHQEIKNLQVQKHEESLWWKKCSAFGTSATPIVLAIIPIIEKWLDSRAGGKKESNKKKRS